MIFSYLFYLIMLLTRRIVQLMSGTHIKCLILHPVSFPNKGPILQQYLAEEAVGLAKSLGWTVLKGPFWNQKGGVDIIDRGVVRGRGQLYVQGKAEELHDGDYIRTSLGSGVLHGDGIIFDQMQSTSEDGLYRQWRDKITRESIANSCLVKVRHINKNTYFGKGKLNSLADYLKNIQFDCLYINTELKPTQIKNLRKIIEAKINNVSIGSAYPQKNEFQSDSEFQTEESSPLIKRRNQPSYRRVSIFDRFSIILQIFAARTTSKISQLQIQLTYLTYARTRLIRDGHTYLTNIRKFSPDFLANTEIPMEVISAKQRKSGRSLGGEGQSQLELERRKIRDREAEIRRMIHDEGQMRARGMQKRQRRGSIYPVVALVGYTNVGKSALMNAFMKRKEVQSKDLLFQTLHTTNRTLTLPTGSKITLLDTIGFITNLPVQMVEAFKSTLEEIAHADLVIHLRDFSHPHQHLQKLSVVNILQEMGFGKAFQETKMMEVWNKIDLVKEHPPEGVHISCLTGEGLKELAIQVEERVMKIKGQSKRVIEYGLEHHSDVMEWLKVSTSHSHNVVAEYNYDKSYTFPHGSVKVDLILDEASLGKLLKYLNPDKKKNKKDKGMPPSEGW